MSGSYSYTGSGSFDWYVPFWIIGQNGQSVYSMISVYTHNAYRCMYLRHPVWLGSRRIVNVEENQCNCFFFFLCTRSLPPPPRTIQSVSVVECQLYSRPLRKKGVLKWSLLDLSGSIPSEGGGGRFVYEYMAGSLMHYHLWHTHVSLLYNMLLRPNLGSVTNAQA